MKNKLNKYRYALILPIYTVVYLCFFALIEKIVTNNYYVIHTKLDDMIPFCEYFVVFYYAWFLYMIGGFFVVALDKSACMKFSLFMMIGMTLFIVVSFVFPNGQDIRATVFPRDNFFTDLVKGMYAIDTPTNVLPSIHVYNSIGAHLALRECRFVKDKPIAKFISFATCVLIILSTMFIKQHSVVDVISGIVLAGIVYLIVFCRLDLWSDKSKK